MGLIVLQLHDSSALFVPMFTLSAPQDVKERLVLKVEERTSNQMTIIWDKEQGHIAWVKTRKSGSKNPSSKSSAKAAKMDKELPSKLSAKKAKVEEEVKTEKSDSEVEICSPSGKRPKKGTSGLAIHDLLSSIEECFGRLERVSAADEWGEKYYFRQAPAWKRKRTFASLMTKQEDE